MEFGINYGRDGIFQADDSLRLKAAYFNNDIDDYIGGSDISIFEPAIRIARLSRRRMSRLFRMCFQYQNFANAKIEGFELESIYDAGWGFAGLSVSIIDGHTVSYEGEGEDLRPSRPPRSPANSASGSSTTS